MGVVVEPRAKSQYQTSTTLNLIFIGKHPFSNTKRAIFISEPAALNRTTLELK